MAVGFQGKVEQKCAHQIDIGRERRGIAHRRVILATRRKPRAEGDRVRAQGVTKLGEMQGQLSESAVCRPHSSVEDRPRPLDRQRYLAFLPVTATTTTAHCKKLTQHLHDDGEGGDNDN